MALVLKNHSVSAVSGGIHSSLRLNLSTERVSWKSSVQTLEITFGKSSERYHIADQGSIRKRQAPSNPDATTAPEDGAVPSTVAFSAPASSTPTATSVQKDLSFSYTDTPLLPPSFPGVDSTTLNAPFV